ncbi:MAG: hypothetical protein AAB774_03045 [Patescibacteria group bacterium]
MKLLKVILAALVAALVVPAFAQAQGGFLDLTKDPFIEGGLNDTIVQDELLPALNGFAPKLKSDEAFAFAFNMDIKKLQVGYRDKKTGKTYTASGSLRAGEKVLGTIESREDIGNGTEKLVVVVRWLWKCANPLLIPFKVILYIPKRQTLGKTIIQRIEVPSPYAVNVKENTIVQQIVPSVGDVVLNVPASQRGRYRLVETSHEEAGRRLEYQKSWWDNLLDFLKVVATPIAQILGRTNISLSATGGAGGTAYGGNAISSSSSSASASASASAAAAAAAGGN